MLCKLKNFSRYARVLIFVLFLGLAAWAMVVVPTVVAAGPDPDAQPFEWVGHYGGPAQGLAVQGDLAYAGFGAELAILDISTPDRPERVGYALLSEQILAVHVSGPYAFVRSPAHWWVLDVSQVSRPTVVREVEAGIEDSVLAQGVVYAAGGGLHIIPLAAPDQAFFYRTPGSVKQVAVMGNTIYLVESSEGSPGNSLYGLRVLNISDPTRPVEVKFYPSNQKIGDIAVANNYLYSIYENRYLQVLDASQPTRLSEVDFYDTTGQVSQVMIEGSYAYLFLPGYSHDLQIVDISTPARPTPLTTLILSNSLRSLAVDNDYLYLAAGIGGVQVLDITDPGHPSEVSRYGAGGWRVMAVAGGYVYWVSGQQQLQLVDFSNPRQPVIVGSYLAPNPIAKVTVANEHAYVLLTGGDLHLVQVSDPTRPKEVGVFTLPGLILDMVIRDNYAYIGTTESSLHIVDLSSPAAPQEIGVIQLTSEWVWGVAVEGDLAYLLGDQLHVVDISNPTAPRQLGATDYHFSDLVVTSASSLVVKDRYVFIGGARIDIVKGDWTLIDATNPAAPVSLNLSHTQKLQTPIDAVVVAGNDLYIGWTTGIQRLDISNPALPLDIGLFPLTGIESIEFLDGVEHLIVSGQQLYASTRNGQVFVLEIKPAPTLPKPSLNLTLANHLGGKTNALFIQDNYAYAGFGPELAVLDIANPNQPVRVGYVILSHASGSKSVIIEDMAVVGAYAYVLTGDNLYLVDISDPAAPSEVNFVPLAGSGRAIAIVDQTAYVLQQYCGRAGSHTSCQEAVHRFDISTPTALTELDRYPLDLRTGYSGESAGQKVTVALDEYLYLDDPQSGLKITNMSGKTTESSYIGEAHMVFADNYAYVTNIDHGDLQIFDLSNPITPTLVSRYDTSKRPTQWIGLTGSVLYFAEGPSFDEKQKGTGSYGLRILEVTNPLAPTELGFFPTSEPVQELKLAGRQAYLVTASGIHMLDLTNPARPLEKGVYHSPPAVFDLVRQGDYAYSAVGDTLNLHVIDISNPEQPQTIAASLSTDPTIKYGSDGEVRLAHTHAYIFDQTRMRVVDISDPPTPQEVGLRNNNWTQVTAVGDYIYTCSNATLQVMTVSNPITWTQVATRSLSSNYCPTEITAAGPTLYLAGPEIGLRLFNISDPAAPVELGKVENIRPYYVAVSGDYAYLVNSEKGPQVYDVSNPAAPALVGEVDLGLFGTSWHPQDLLAVDQYLYLADGPVGLRVLDVSDPTTPTEVGYYSLPAWARRITLVDDYIYVAAQEGGLFIFQTVSGN